MSTYSLLKIWYVTCLKTTRLLLLYSPKLFHQYSNPEKSVFIQDHSVYFHLVICCHNFHERVRQWGRKSVNMNKHTLNKTLTHHLNRFSSATMADLTMKTITPLIWCYVRHFCCLFWLRDPPVEDNTYCVFNSAHKH